MGDSGTDAEKGDSIIESIVEYYFLPPSTQQSLTVTPELTTIDTHTTSYCILTKPKKNKA